MDEFEKLYNVVSETKLYSKSFDEFKEKYSNEENINKLYNVVSETKLYSKSFDEFKDKYFNQQSLTPPVSKKAQAVPSGGSESVSANITSSSESVDPNNAIKLQERATKEIIQEYEKQGVKNYNITPEEVNERATVIQLKDQTTPVFDRNSLNLPDKDYQGLAAYEATQKPDYEKFTVEKQKKNFEELANRDTFKYKKSIINEPIDYENTVLNFTDQQKEDIAVQKPETVSKIYGGDLDQYGIDFEDFNGYIEGGNNRIKKLYKDGYFTDDTTDFFKSESDEKLIREVAKNNTLSGYVKDRVDYLNGKYLGLINTNNLEGARKVEDEIKKITKGYQQYVNDKLPTYKKAIDDKLVKEYDEYKNQKTLGGIKKERGITDLHKKLGDITFGNFFGGIGKATSNITSFALDLVGSEGEAEYQRMIQETNDELDHNSLTYGVVSGKKVNHKGKNLIVSSKGRIIDTDESKDITSIADKIGIDRDTVLEKAKQSEEEGTTYSLMGLISMGASTLGDLAVQLATTKGLLGGANKVSKLKALGTSMAVQSGMVTSSVYEDTLSQLRKANINDEKAIGEALDLSFNAGLLTAGLSIISPDTKALGVSLKGVDKKFSKELAESYVKFGKEGFKRTFAKKAAEKGIDLTSEGGKQVLEELGENIGQKKLNEGVNEEVGKDVLDTKITKGEIIETGLLSFSTIGLVTALNSKSPSINKDRFGMLEYFAQDVETSKEFINNFKEEGAISESSANDIIKDIETYAKYSNKIPEDTPIEKLDPLLKAVDKRNELELKKKNQDKAFHKEINEEIEKVDEEIAEIRSSKVDEEITKDQETDVDNKTEDVLSDQEYEKMLDDYNTAVEIGAIDESAITELELADRRNAEEGELLQEELELLDSTEKQTGDKYAFIHKNLRGIRSQDYGGIAGDNNLRKDNKSFNILYANKKAIPLDGQAQVMSQKFGDEITPQDIIDYVEDRERNPEKYKTSKDKRKKLEKAIEINFDLESSTDAYKRYMNLDDSKESFEALDKLEDKVLTNEQISIIKKYLKQKGDVKKQLKTNKTTSRGVQQLDETTQRSERRNEGKEENKGVEKVAGTSGTKTKNIKGLYDVNRKIFNLNRVQALASSVIQDRMIGQMAKRAGISKEKMYDKIEFKKGDKNTLKDLPKGIKFQIDAFHGSPYQFDKFQLSKIGTGEGLQAFGWGLYFTDLESIARHYANVLSEYSFYINGKNVDNVKKEYPSIYVVGFDLLGAKSKQDAINAVKNSKIASNKQKSKAIELLNSLESFSSKKDSRFLYEVTLFKGKTPDQYTWLEWDKELTKEQKQKIAEQAIKEGLTKVAYTNESGVNVLNTSNNITGETYYKELQKSFLLGSDKEVSLFLLRAGIDGIKYPAESISRGATSDTARGFNYVVFDENAVSIEEVIKFQKDAEKTRGAAMVNMDGTAIIYALTDPNVSTPLHEMAHVYEHYLNESEKTAIKQWAKTKEWTTETSEKFARGFEKYLADGKAPTSDLRKMFERFKKWLTDIYNGIKDSEIDLKLNDEMKTIYDKMLGGDQVEKQSGLIEKQSGLTKTKKPTKKTKTSIDESKIEDVDFEEVDGKKEKPKDKVRPEKVIHEEYVDNDGNELIATTTKDGTKTFYYKQKGKSFSFGTGKKKTATQQELVDNGILSTSTTPIKSYTSLDAGKGKSFENDLKQLLQDRIKEIKTQIKEEKKESKRSVLIEELNNKKKQLSSLNKDTTRTNMSQELDEQLDEVIEEISKKESEKETKLTQLQKLNKFISGGRKRVFGFVNKTTLPIVSEIELIGSKLSELQMISKENAKKYKTTYKKALENYIFKSKLDKETAKVNLTGMVKDLMTPVDRNTNSKDAYDQLSKVSKDLADTVIGLRSHIDSFSKIVTEDPAFERMSEESKQNILDNLGDYVHQTYLYFKEKDYNPSEGLINEAIREEAKQIMIDEGIGYKKAIDKATKTVNDLLEKWDDIRNPKNTYSSINTSTNTLSMSDDSLKAKVRKAKNKKLWDQAVKEASEKYPKFKKNHKMVLDEAISIYEGLGGLFQPMPDHIKKLLGDIKLPEDQYLSTMMAVGKMVYKAQALKTINDRFFGEFIFNEKPTKNAKEYVQVNDKSSPLHGKWVNEFIAKEFEQEPIYKANTTVGQIYFNALTAMRKSKILPTSSTWFKNITGLAVFGQILNGNFILLEDPKAFFQSVAGRGKMMFTGNRTDFTKQIFADAAEAGVLSTDINLITMGYIDDMYKQMSLGNESAAINKFDKLQKTIRRGAGKLDKELGQRYAQVDDYGKAMAVYAQKGSMAKKLYGKEYKDLTETERIDVLRQTGNDVKLGNPTFSRLPSWFKDVARFPTGDYVSFQIEATRSFVGAIAIAYNDIKTVSTGVDFRGNKINDVQRKAYLKSFGKRSAGISLIVGFNLLLKHSIESIYRYFSDDDEEEIILKKEAVNLRPFWVDDNLIIENIDEKGNAKFIDYSGQDPYAKTIGMMHLDYSSVKGLFEPNMLISLIREAYGGKTDFGQQLYTKEEHPFFKFLKGVKHILVGGYTPPQAVSMIYGAKKAKKEDENWGSVGDWSRLAASRAAFRKYDFNIYASATSLVWDVTDDDSAPKLGYSKNESQMIFRIQNIKKVRDAVNVLNMHYYKNKNKNTNEGVSKFQNALVRNFSSWERNNLISVSEEEFIRQVEDLKKNPQKAIKQK